MKKVFALLMTLGLVVIMTGAAFTAWFSDSETSSGNNFTAGTLDLSVEKMGGGKKIKLEDVHPSQEKAQSFRLTNVGSIAGDVAVKSIVVSDYEQGCFEPEEAAGDGTCGDGAGQGELGKKLITSLVIDRNCDGADKNDYHAIKEKSLSSWSKINGPLDARVKLAGGESVCVVVKYVWEPTNNDNEAQSDSSELDLEFVLNQSR